MRNEKEQTYPWLKAYEEGYQRGRVDGLSGYTKMRSSNYLKRKTLKKTIVYRVLSIVSEFIMVALVTGNLIAPTLITGGCLVVHTSLYYLVERKWH